MPEVNTLIVFGITFAIPAIFFLYYFVAKTAINAAIDEHQEGKRAFTLPRWMLVIIILICLVSYAFVVKPFERGFELISQQAVQINTAVIIGLFYLSLEVPYQLVKVAAKDIAEALLAAGDDRRSVARLKAAETLAVIMGRKLKVSCELQAFSSNEEFVFVTYILGDKPVATRLKLNQADKAESWKKLGEWIMGNYQNQK